MQRVRATTVDGPLRGGQRLTEHLAAEDLCTAYIPAFATEYVLLDPLQLEQLQEVFEYGMHGRGGVGYGCARVRAARIRTSGRRRQSRQYR